MGFLDKLKTLIFGPDYDKEVRNLSKRISELNAQKRSSDSKLERLKKDLKIPDLRINRLKNKEIDVKPFIPPKLHSVRTMKDLMQERKEKEAERRRLLFQKATKNIDIIKAYVNDEDLNSAENLLFRTSSALKELKDAKLKEIYGALQNDINKLRAVLRQREVERLKAEAKQKAEEEKRKREEERERKQREEAERLEKERQAREYEEKLAREEEARRLEIERLTSLVAKRKEDAERILQYLRMKGITRFYHFTDERNLMKIKKLGGLYSWYYCERNGIDIPNPGGDSNSRMLDGRHGLQDYVRLSFCSDHPMAWRKHITGASLVLLYIDVDVAAFKETLFTDRNAASNSFACGGGYEDLMKVNIPATRRNYVSRSEGEIFSLHQAECMVKTFLPLRYVTNIDNPIKMIFNDIY